MKSFKTVLSYYEANEPDKATGEALDRICGTLGIPRHFSTSQMTGVLDPDMFKGERAGEVAITYAKLMGRSFFNDTAAAASLKIAVKKLNELKEGDVIRYLAAPGKSLKELQLTQFDEFPLPSRFVGVGGAFACFDEVSSGQRFGALYMDDWIFSVDLDAREAKTPAVDEFPHRCPRCGAKAYVGLLEVSHANEKAAARCPARRG